jgi:hypothetical protein
LGPVSLLAWLMGRPARRRARERREAEGSGAPDGGGKTAADAVPPVREEP